MITGPLVYALDRASSPRMVRAITRALEFTTGVSTRALLEKRAASYPISFNPSTYTRDWYRENGYYGISSLVGSLNTKRIFEASALFGGLKILGEDVGSVPLKVYRRTADVREEERTHPLWRILHDEANPETAAMEFREALTVHAALYGNGFARKVRNSEGKLIALWQLMPEDVEIKRDDRGLLYYNVNRDGKWTATPRTEIFRLSGFGITGSGGASLLEYAKRTIELLLDQTEYAHRFFSQDQTPPIYIRFPDSKSPEELENIKAAWREYHEGPDRWHAPAVLGEGGEIKSLNPNHQESQLVEQRRFQIVEVCRLLRISPHKLADLERATFSNIEHLNIQHYTETLRPWYVRWEQAISRDLLSEEEKGVISAEHEIEGFLRGDFKTQTDGFSRLLDKGVYSINEVRRLYNLNPIEGGDDHFIQINMGTIQDVAAGIVNNEPPGEATEKRLQIISRKGA